MLVNWKPTTADAYKLFHDGTLALARAERHGLHIDVDYCRQVQTHLERQITHLQKKVNTSEFVRNWRRTFGAKFSLGSDDQLGHMLFTVMKLDPIKKTGSGKPSVDQESLEAVDVEEVRDLLRIRKLEKVKGTYIQNFLEEQVDGVIHTVFNLNLVRTYRSSAQDPNIQNIPNREPEIKKLTRRAIKARPGHKLLCGDFKGIEVGVAACYHKDPTMITYVSDKTKDMHRDMAMECYLLPQDQVIKPVRHTAKNKFVFPQFYGDWWKTCAEAMWAASGTDTHKLKNGTPLRDWMRNKGISELGTLDKMKPSPRSFYAHIQKVEDRFWNDRFPEYTQWKDAWVKSYQAKGYFQSLTGFICSGVMSRNESINYPVQGSAFHCLLQCLVWMDEWLLENGMDSRIAGQIHDELIMDVHPDEEVAVVRHMQYLMTERLPAHWSWIIVPLEVELEASPVDGTWYDKAPEHVVYH